MTVELRPQTIGALVARAISLYARNAGALLAAFAVVWIPTLIVQLVVQRDFPAVDFGQLVGQALQHPNDPGFVRTLAQLQSESRGLMLLNALLAPLGNNMVIVTAAGIINGNAVPLGAALRRSLRLWLPGIIVWALFYAIGLVCIVPSLLIALLIVLAALLLHAPALTGAAPVVIALIECCVMAVLMMSGTIAAVALVLEDANPFRAAGLALRRVLDRGLVRRTLGVAFGYFAIGLGGGISLTVAWVAAGPLHVQSIAAILASIASAVLGGVLLVFMLLYARDIRVRREGADLLAALDAPAPVPEARAADGTSRDDGLAGADRAVIAGFLERRDALAPAARRVLAMRIAERVRPKLRASFAHLDDEALLEHLARP